MFNVQCSYIFVYCIFICMEYLFIFSLKYDHVFCYYTDFPLNLFIIFIVLNR